LNFEFARFFISLAYAAAGQPLHCGIR